MDSNTGRGGFSVGDLVVYTMSTGSYSEKYEKSFSGEVLKVFKEKLRVKIRNSSGKEQIKDVLATNVRILES